MVHYSKVDDILLRSMLILFGGSVTVNKTKTE